MMQDVFLLTAQIVPIRTASSNHEQGKTDRSNWTSQTGLSIRTHRARSRFPKRISDKLRAWHCSPGHQLAETQHLSFVGSLLRQRATSQAHMFNFVQRLSAWLHSRVAAAKYAAAGRRRVKGKARLVPTSTHR